MTNPSCPECGSARVHRSRHRCSMERAIAVLGGGMRRCHSCNSRYAVFGASWLRMTDLRGISRRLLLVFAMAAAALLIMAVTLWFGHVPSTPAGDTGQVAGPGISGTSS
jgi:hypothetical protein